MSSLTNDQRSEIEKMVESKVSGINVRIEANYNVIDSKLESILKQTTKHNDRMSKAEDKIYKIEKDEVTHFTNCPIVERVGALEDKDVAITSVKVWKDKWLKIIIALAGSGLIFNQVVKIFEFFTQ